MEDKTLLQYIWHIRINRILLTTLVVATVMALLLKWLVWQNLLIYPFIFFSIVIPIQLIVAGAIQYKFYQEWTEILKTYSDRLQLRENVKVYTRNFFLPGEMRNLKNQDRLSKTPYYEFERADILESKDLVIVRGRRASFNLFHSTTRPFAIPLTEEQKNQCKLYKVDFVSMNETDAFKELTFVDNAIGSKDQITLRIYKANESFTLH